MRHARKTIKLGRKSEHRDLLLANQVCSLISQNRIKTTLAKAKAVRPFAERMITLGKRGDLHARRVALSFLRQKDAVQKLFAELAPRTADRQGGYCRIVKLGPRPSDSAPMAYLEFVDQPAAETVPEAKSATAKKNK
jgi:large subunit ribosomal protein L17